MSYLRKIRVAIFLFLFSIGDKVFAQEAAVPNIQKVMDDQLQTAKKVVDVVMEFSVKYSFQVLGGVIVIVLGWLVTKQVAKIVERLLGKQKVDVTVSKFIVGTVKITIMTFAVIVALGKFGIEIAPLIAGVSVAGFGLSFALQGPLSNYASGATLIFTKPFKVGEIIEVAGVVGQVIDMKLPRTELKTVDGNMVVIPNKHIVGEIIHNYSTSKRVDVTVGVSYNADIDKAIQIVKDVIQNDERVVRSPNIGISEFADSSVNIYARIFTKQDNYWDVLFDVNKKIFDAFNKNGIEIPFPQRDVHILEKK